MRAQLLARRHCDRSLIMMKLLLLALCVACACADVSHVVQKTGDKEARITKQELDVGPDGKYEWSFEAENGIAQHAHGELKNLGTENEAQHQQGEAQWTSPEGEVIHLAYQADENGYQPEGAHLPTPPPIPEAILRALQYIKDHPPPPEKN